MRMSHRMWLLKMEKEIMREQVRDEVNYRVF
jgi:hypothetical protein